MMLIDVIDNYLAQKRSLGMRFESPEVLLRRFCRVMGNPECGSSARPFTVLECGSNDRGHPRRRGEPLSRLPGQDQPPCSTLPGKRLTRKGGPALAVAVPNRLDERGGVIVDPKGRGLAAERCRP